MVSNGVRRPLWRNGPGVPLTTPFKAGLDEIDHQALAKQVVRCAKAGINIVLLGTTGEASHLSNAERKAAVVTARRALDDAGLQDAPLLVGTGGGSLQTTLELTQEAADAGASHAIVILPGYFSFAMRNDRQAILDFFKGVMDRSPLPVMIYNFPGAAGGIDMSSDELSELADHDNCFGVKLTCGNIGKGHRIANYVRSAEYKKRKGAYLDSVVEGGDFQILPGFSDTLLSALTAHHTGCITSTGALFPKTIRRLYDQGLKGLAGDQAAFNEARQLQDRIARSDGIAVATSFQGAKHFLDHFVEQGLGGECRLPLGKIDEKTKRKVEEALKEDVEFENSL